MMFWMDVVGSVITWVLLGGFLWALGDLLVRIHRQPKQASARQEIRRLPRR